MDLVCVRLLPVCLCQFHFGFSKYLQIRNHISIIQRLLMPKTTVMLWKSYSIVRHHGFGFWCKWIDSMYTRLSHHTALSHSLSLFLRIYCTHSAISSSCQKFQYQIHNTCAVYFSENLCLFLFLSDSLHFPITL